MPCLYPKDVLTNCGYVIVETGYDTWFIDEALWTCIKFWESSYTDAHYLNISTGIHNEKIWSRNEENIFQYKRIKIKFIFLLSTSSICRCWGIETLPKRPNELTFFAHMAELIHQPLYTWQEGLKRHTPRALCWKTAIEGASDNISVYSQ